MADQLCEAQKGLEVEDEYGRALPAELVPCENPSKFLVTRNFSGVKQQLCGVHARRFIKDETGAFAVADLANVR